ncbi:hypothetical protein HK104_010615 [Borealophlyctis nickersoniae]|nr:hypothetical protein HK104_010615 [Borealophlyctis nickersoniae]
MASVNVPESYPTPLHAPKDEFPTPEEAAVKGLNPNPEPVITGLSDMPELPELVHGTAAPAHGPTTSSPTTATPTSSSAGEKEPRWSDPAKREAAKRRAKAAASNAANKAKREAKTWAHYIEDAVDAYWPAIAVGAAVTVAYLVVAKKRPELLPVWLRRA